MEGDGSLVIKGIRIISDVIRKKAVQQCAYAQCMGACCSGGVWLEPGEDKRILEFKDDVKNLLPSERHDESAWFCTGSSKEDGSNNETGTVPVPDPVYPDRTCCIFMQPDRKCALQVISLAHNLGWPGIKPFHCSTYPLLFEDGILSIDETPLDFNGNASCLYGEQTTTPVYKLYRDEAILILGKDGYDELLRKAEEIT
jgi:hypothetical protein